MRQMFVKFHQLLSVIGFTQLLVAFALPEAAVVVFYSSEGPGNWGMMGGNLAQLWADRLEQKKLDPTWPVNATVEVVDFKSNFAIMQNWTVSRMSSSSLPPVSTFVFNDMGIEMMPWFSQFEVPCILSSLNANGVTQSADQGVGYNYTFFLEPAKQYYARELVDVYLQAGVKTIVAIADIGDYYLNPGLPTYSYSYEGCIRSAEELFVPKGIELLESFTFDFFTATRDDYVSIVETTKKLNPDAILLCDVGITNFPEYYDSWIVNVMKDLDYLPKALNIEDTYGSAMASYFVPSGLLNYFTQATFSHPKNKGIDFTEDAAPYSSQFVEVQPKTVGEAILAGSNLPGYNSSANLFANWYYSQFGFYPQYVAVGMWASYDAVECALYHASKIIWSRPNNAISANEMHQFLLQTDVATPYGRVIFDVNRVNTQSYVSLMQFFDSDQNTELISPKSQATHSFVYPMPTWKERSYSWSLLKGNVIETTVMAAVCSVLIVAMLITLGIHRNEADVRMLNYNHLVCLGLSALIILWSLVFVWQGDVVEAQCNAYLWTIYLPGSFLVMLVNMKAYRLSVFITSENKARKRKLNHTRIMILTLSWVGLTAVMLLIAQVVDPPTRALVQTDIYRPSTDYYVCRYGGITSGILYFLIIGHVFMSILCVFFVRNGSESFKDGLIMKEAFVIFFTCVFITYIFSHLGLSNQSFYLLRSIFMGVGVTAFIFRLLFTRCLKHWLTLEMKKSILKVYHIYRSYVPETTTVAPSENKKSSMDMLANDIEDPYVKDDVEIDSSDNIEKVFEDEKRFALFRELAAKGLLTENVDFLIAVKNLPQKYEKALIDSSCLMSNSLHEAAKTVYDEFCIEGSVNEVNISSKVRAQLKQRLFSIPKDQSILSEKPAKIACSEDLLKMNDLFDTAVQEIKFMLHQNLWNKFKTTETEIQMGSDL